MTNNPIALMLAHAMASSPIPVAAQHRTTFKHSREKTPRPFSRKVRKRDRLKRIRPIVNVKRGSDHDDQ